MRLETPSRLTAAVAAFDVNVNARLLNLGGYYVDRHGPLSRHCANWRNERAALHVMLWRVRPNPSLDGVHGWRKALMAWSQVA